MMDETNGIPEAPKGVENATEDKPVKRDNPVTREKIEAALLEIVGPCECVWGPSHYNKRISLRVFFEVRGRRCNFEIRDELALEHIAMTVIGLHSKVRARVLAQLTRSMANAAEVEKSNENANAIQREKNRMAGRLPQATEGPIERSAESAKHMSPPQNDT